MQQLYGDTGFYLAATDDQGGCHHIVNSREVYIFWGKVFAVFDEIEAARHVLMNLLGFGGIGSRFPKCM